MAFTRMFLERCADNTMIKLVLIGVVIDTVFGVMRAIKWRKFNSSVGIDGAIRKGGMILSLVFFQAIDILVHFNLIRFIPEEIRSYIGGQIGLTEFFAILYIAYEVTSILKNMALCGLPVKHIWEAVSKFLHNYTDELPDADELDKKKHTQ